MVGGNFGGCGGGGGGGFLGGGNFGGGGGYHPGAKNALNGGAFGARPKHKPITQHGGRGLAAVLDGSVDAPAHGDGPVEKAEGEELDQVGDETGEDELESLESKLAKAKAKAKPKVVPKPKGALPKAMKVVAKAAGGAAAKVIKKAAAKTGPHWGYEESRKQIMCRTGKEGAGQSHAIKYEVVGGKAAAVKLAEAWVAKQKKKTA